MFNLLFVTSSVFVGYKLWYQDLIADWEQKKIDDIKHREALKRP
jgi:hypothetical protein